MITAAEGMHLIDSDGNRYLDGVSSLWCNVHGHRVPEIDAAVRAQLDKVAHTTMLGLASEPAILLADRLDEARAAEPEEGLLQRRRRDGDGGRVQACRAVLVQRRPAREERVRRVRRGVPRGHGRRDVGRPDDRIPPPVFPAAVQGALRTDAVRVPLPNACRRRRGTGEAHVPRRARVAACASTAPASRRSASSRSSKAPPG